MDKQKQTITKVATKLFLHYEFKGITMDTVAREGHISKKTIYRHFSNKESLITTVLDELGLNIKKMTDSILIQSDNCLEACYFVYFNIFGQSSTNNSLIHWTLKKYYPTCYEHFYQYLWMVLLNTTCSVIKDGIDKKLILEEVDPRGFCYVITNSLLHITNRTQVIKAEFDIAELIEKTIYYNIRSILTPSGMALLPQVIQNKPKFKHLQLT
jgi:AcrR family transcriptional regulator